ncbi:MAG TPA: amino acid ABC transporter permease [Acidimicrobiales bacterium]|nr:amino acid ABC transporter permease [Acidimicrobiales bacterium]
MTAPVLGDVLGPRGRLRVRIASLVTGLLLAVFLVVAFRRLSDSGQLTVAKWKPFTDAAVLRFLGVGLLTTLRLAAVSMVLAMVFGSLLALGRLARNGPTRWLTGGWVEVFRAVPLLLMIYFSARGLPRLDIDLPAFWYVVVGLVLYNSAVLAEIFRAGILSLDLGQSEAASALGMTYWQTMLSVVIPQAFRRMVPAIVSQLITLLKDTSLAFIVAFEEFLRRAFFVGEVPGKPLLQALFLAALVYIAINFTLSRIARRLEVRQRRRYGAGRIAVTGAEDLAVTEAHASGAGV